MKTIEFWGVLLKCQLLPLLAYFNVHALEFLTIPFTILRTLYLRKAQAIRFAYIVFMDSTCVHRNRIEKTNDHFHFR